MGNDLIDRNILLGEINKYTYDAESAEAMRIEHIVKAHICELIEKQPAVHYEVIPCAQNATPACAVHA